jgi:predicted amidohydrolase
MSSAEPVSFAAVTARLDWRYRYTCSGEHYDAEEAERVVRAHLAGNLERMEAAARQGARLILGPEYFGATELFTVSPEERRALLGRVNPLILDGLKALARRREVWLGAALMMDHGGETVETGVLVDPDGETVRIQLKNKGLSGKTELERGFALLATGDLKVGLFTCADATDYPGECLELARRGMKVMLIPGCGFAGEDWFHFLKVRSQDLGCVVVYADESRAAILDPSGRVRARSDAADAVIVAEISPAPNGVEPR